MSSGRGRGEYVGRAVFIDVAGVTASATAEAVVGVG